MNTPKNASLGASEHPTFGQALNFLMNAIGPKYKELVAQRQREAGFKTTTAAVVFQLYDDYRAIHPDASLDPQKGWFKESESHVVSKTHSATRRA